MHLKAFGAAAITAFAISTAAWAHHSHANYQTLQWTNLTGVVKEVHWLNPHVWVYMTAKDESGKDVLWTLEGGSPAALTRGGWTKDSVKAGDTINVRCHHAKDLSPNCLLGFLTPPGGVPKEFD
jgi:hypothetical protein